MPAVMLHWLASMLRRRVRGVSAVSDRQHRRRRPVFLVIAILIGIGLGGSVGIQLKVYSMRSGTSGSPEQREMLYQLLRPVALSNCDLQRFGEPNDGGYLLCANLLNDVQAGYSYGINGYDQWGCDISTKRRVPVHQYDCFNTTRPVCSGGNTIFHNECVGDTAFKEEGRVFDTMQGQVVKNGDAGKSIVLKIDVEGAEWGAFLTAPDELLSRIDQIAVEFHGIDDQKSVAAVRRLQQFFEVAHIHFNNASCMSGMKPFPSWAYEVLFVNKRLAVVDPSGKSVGVHPLAAPNKTYLSDCQPAAE